MQWEDQGQRLHHNKQSRIKEYSAPPTASEGSNGDIAAVKSGFGGISLYVKAFSAWHLFKSDNITSFAGGWTPLSFEGNWVNYGSTYNPVGYKVTRDGLCHLRGVARKTSGGGNSDSTILILPPIIRPDWDLNFCVTWDQDVEYAYSPTSDHVEGSKTKHNPKNNRLIIDEGTGAMSLVYANGHNGAITWVALDTIYWFVGDKAKNEIKE